MDNPSNLVVLLEQDYDVAVSLGTQDIRATLLAGLNWEIPSYWVDCAIKWLEQGHKIDQEIFEILNLISENKAYKQSTRHKAFKIAKRWQREQNI